MTGHTDATWAGVLPEVKAGEALVYLAGCGWPVELDHWRSSDMQLLTDVHRMFLYTDAGGVGKAAERELLSAPAPLPAHAVHVGAGPIASARHGTPPGGPQRPEAAALFSAAIFMYGSTRMRCPHCQHTLQHAARPPPAARGSSDIWRSNIYVRQYIYALAPLRAYAVRVSAGPIASARRSTPPGCPQQPGAAAIFSAAIHVQQCM